MVAAGCGAISGRPASPTTSRARGGRIMAHKVMNFGSLLTQTARRLPNHPGVIQGERRWSWAELDRRTDAMVAALRRRGFGAGDRLIILSYNNNAVIEALYAGFKLGGVVVPVNFRLTPVEIA